MLAREVEGKLRPVCLACGYVHFVDPKVAVGALIIEQEAILLVQRRYPPAAGQWSIPAGFMDRGETPQAAVARECLEETRLQVQVGLLVELITKQPGSAEGADFLLVYTAQVMGGDLHAGDDAMAVAYFAVENLPQLAFPATERVIQLWCARG